jgi:hypothetical protein
MESFYKTYPLLKRRQSMAVIYNVCRDDSDMATVTLSSGISNNTDIRTGICIAGEKSLEKLITITELNSRHSRPLSAYRDFIVHGGKLSDSTQNLAVDNIVAMQGTRANGKPWYARVLSIDMPNNKVLVDWLYQV